MRSHTYLLRIFCCKGSVRLITYISSYLVVGICQSVNCMYLPVTIPRLEARYVCVREGDILAT